MESIATKRVSLPLYVALLLWGTLTPQTEELSTFLWLVDQPIIEMLINFILLMPLATILMVRFQRSFVQSSFIAFATTICIESCQLIIPGRISDGRDIVLNTGGAILIGLLLKKKLLANPRR